MTQEGWDIPNPFPSLGRAHNTAMRHATRPVVGGIPGVDGDPLLPLSLKDLFGAAGHLVAGAFSGGGDEADPQSDSAADNRARVLDLVERQQPIPADMLIAFSEDFPDEYAEFFGDDDGTVLSPNDVALMSGWTPPAQTASARSGAAGGSPSELLYDTMFSLVEELPKLTDPIQRFSAMQDIASMAAVYESLRGLEQGSVRLDDGTLITQEMLNNSDPALRMQYQQAYGQRQRDIENQSREILNKYNLDQYTLDQGAIDAENSRRVSETNSAIDSVRTRLERDELDITRAAEEVDRIIRGQQEGRARADLEVKTQENARPWATGGKTSFSPADVGMERLAALAGIRNMSAPVIRYPGTMNIDPRAAIQYWDQQGGVAGGTSPIPGVSVTDAEIPRGVRLRAPLPAPQLRAPRTGVITLPPGNPFAQAPQAPSQVPYITMPR